MSGLDVHTGSAADLCKSAMIQVEIALAARADLQARYSIITHSLILVSVIDSYVRLASDFFLRFFVFRFSFYCLHVLCYSHCIVTSRVCRDVLSTHNNNNNYSGLVVRLGAQPHRGPDFNRGTVATAPGEKLLTGRRRPVRNLTLLLYDTIRYDTRCYFNVRSKADMSQLNLPHGTDN